MLVLAPVRQSSPTPTTPPDPVPTSPPPTSPTSPPAITDRQQATLRTLRREQGHLNDAEFAHMMRRAQGRHLRGMARLLNALRLVYSRVSDLLDLGPSGMPDLLDPAWTPREFWRMMLPAMQFNARQGIDWLQSAVTGPIDLSGQLVAARLA